MNKVSFVFIIALLFFAKIHSQEIVKKTSFPIRDFFFESDSIFLIKKRHLDVLDSHYEHKELQFIGGYGIKMVKLGKNEILTASNELRRDVSSVRFYDKRKKTVNKVYYYKEGNFLDFILVPNENMFLFSTRENKIVVVRYGDRPKFKKIKEFDLGSFSRKIIYEQGNIYCITDNGELYEFTISSGQLKLLYKAEGILTDFQFNKGIFYISNITGEVIRYDSRIGIAQEILKLKDDFVTTSLMYEGNLLVGTWEGSIFVQSDDGSLSFKKKIHNKAIYKILAHKNYLYSCSLDKTLKKWKI